MAIDRGLLETFENKFPNREYEIKHICNEFTSICPKTGQPDFGVMYFRYTPAEVCVELKSLKMYMQQYRNEGIFYENVTNTILDDLIAVVKPRWAELKAEFTVRGGFSSVITVEYFDENAEVLGR